MTVHITKATAAILSVTTTEKIVQLATVPEQCLFTHLQGTITDILTGAATIEWALASDAAGAVLITDRVIEDIEPGKGSTVAGGISTLLSDRGHDDGPIYLLYSCDAGTCSLVPTLYCRENR